MFTKDTTIRQRIMGDIKTIQERVAVIKQTLKATDMNNNPPADLVINADAIGEAMMKLDNAFSRNM